MLPLNSFQDTYILAYMFILTFFIGSIMGSFINCVAWRIAHGEDFVRGRSHCPVCGHTLTPFELIPIVSYLMQKGKSRCCKEKISMRYPATELLTALVFVTLVWKFGLSLDTLMFMVLGLILMAIALVDLETGIIPDGLIIAGILNFVLFTCLKGDIIFLKLLKGALAGLAISAPILILSLVMDHFLHKESMGGGDIKLYFIVGLYFSIQVNVLLVLLSCVFGILFTLIFQNIRVEDEENPMAFPFGPSIAMAAMTCVFFGQPILQFYLGLF
ncbi:prepilin peptidase [Anaerotignum propionicum]|uniref:Prepilin leader peptidase/N-methyltransferase n=1 Tax=Anaerotignum propionicum DSM 1682 TaxID=991789 RepID=A0A0X8V9Z1_ANAPI|nr:A24 family peptidase [Anaerotignum propionicum]AMJ41747.1 type 4 prepilin-like protein leader peptide-processing enzyme [Anaerotignum propionicum DSM 1682]SHE83722.1 leader peptidase (prepilin peptidase) / N-methyltransferase [[Clostridium] propionicum DSM 1682] [Anaerotignum propionicum DSM 1682]